MKLFVKLLLLLASLSAVSACHGVVDDSHIVPEGVLRVFADKTKITADGQDVVTFRVMFGSQDVSKESTCRLIREFEGDKKYMSYGANEFTTVSPGKYRFTASYYYAGNHESDNSVEIEAEQFYYGETKDYAKRHLALLFTSTECTSCPHAAKGLVELQNKYPGEISCAAIHSYMVASDPMEIEESVLFRTAFSVSGLPRLFWNMKKGTNLIGPDFEDSFLLERSSESASCGVELETVLSSDKSSMNVSVGVTSNYPISYRYIVFIVEDGIDKYQQTGEYYVHNNVVRDVLSTSVDGDKMNDGLPFTTGVQVKAEKTVKIDPEWNTDNIRVIACALSSSDGGNSYTVENVAECRAGENSGTGTESGNSKYNKQVCVMEFTGAWCSFCPVGYSSMNMKIQSKELWKENVNMIALHSNKSGTDDLALPVTDDICNMFRGGNLSYPAYVVDMRDCGEATAEGGMLAFTEALDASFEEHPAYCGVAVSSVYDSAASSAEITVKVASERSETYRVAVFVVEDRVKYKQNDQGIIKEDYNHRHVARKLVTTYQTTTFTGEKITSDGVINAGQEASKTWKIDVDPLWNLENTEVYALVIGEDGNINNMNICALNNGDSGYDLK